ncbi:MAG: hypothetical protein IT177_26050 [Acidobacteria bacterium]|nr:hypothetical protein [Acidobacteriota bacterium]
MSTPWRKWTARIGIGLGALWTMARWLWDAASNIAQAREFFENRGPIMDLIGSILLSGWIGPLVVVACLVTYAALERGWLDRSPDAGVWRTHEARFERLTGDLYAIWSYLTESGQVFWGIHKGEAGATTRELQAFEAEAAAAAADIAKMGDAAPQKFKMLNASAVDTWLNTVGALVDPKTDFEGNGILEGRRTLSGPIENLIEASRIACARLGAGAVQLSPRARQSRCFELTRLIKNLDAEINLAVDNGYAEQNRKSIEGWIQEAGDWLSLQFGPEQRQLFLTAPPYPRDITECCGSAK